VKKNILTGTILLNFISVILYGQSSEKLPIPSMDIRVYAPSISDSANHTFLFQNTINIKKIKNGLYYVRVGILPEQACQPGCIDIPLTIGLNNQAEMNEAKKSFHWIPNIKKTPGDIIAQHVFRSPCIILTLKKNAVIFIPDINEIKNNGVAPYYLDLNYSDKSIRVNYGLSNYNVTNHQYYKKNNKLFPLTGKLELAFYILISPGTAPLATLKATNNFLWQYFAKEYTHFYLPQTLPYKEYANIGYSMALKNYWVKAQGQNKGGITLSTYYDETTKKFGGRFYKRSEERRVGKEWRSRWSPYH